VSGVSVTGFRGELITMREEYPSTGNWVIADANGSELVLTPLEVRDLMSVLDAVSAELMQRSS
jgi:hypothetical protein